MRLLNFAMFYLFNGTISPNAQMHLDKRNDPAAPLTLAPNPIQGLFILSILVIQLFQTWTTKK